MLGSSLRLGPAPFTPERSAPGRFPPRALGRRCAGNRTGTAALVFETGMQRTDRRRPYPKIINKAATSTRTTSKTDQGTKNQLSRLMRRWLSPIDQDQLDLSQRAGDA